MGFGGSNWTLLPPKPVNFWERTLYRALSMTQNKALNVTFSDWRKWILFDVYLHISFNSLWKWQKIPEFFPDWGIFSFICQQDSGDFYWNQTLVLKSSNENLKNRHNQWHTSFSEACNNSLWACSDFQTSTGPQTKAINNNFNKSE